MVNAFCGVLSGVEPVAQYIDYDGYIKQYWCWIQIKKGKSAITTQQQNNDRSVTTQNKILITYDNALFTTSILSQRMSNLISVGMRQVGQHQVMVSQGLG